MFDLSLLSPEVMGSVAAVVAGILTLVPALGMSDSRRAWVAIGVLVLFVLGKNNFTYSSLNELFTAFMQAAVYAVAVYKLALQPIVLPTANRGLASMGIKPNYLG